MSCLRCAYGMDVFISEFTTNVASIYAPIESDVWQSNALHRTNQLFVIIDGSVLNIITLMPHNLRTHTQVSPIFSKHSSIYCSLCSESEPPIRSHFLNNFIALILSAILHSIITLDVFFSFIRHRCWWWLCWLWCGIMAAIVTVVWQCRRWQRRRQQSQS